MSVIVLIWQLSRWNPAQHTILPYLIFTRQVPVSQFDVTKSRCRYFAKRLTRWKALLPTFPRMYAALIWT
jgi:hypothetical protein